MMEEEEEEEEEEEAWLQLRPTEPLPTQCCGGACKPCIFDIYHQQLSRWKEARVKKDKSLLWRKKEECYETGLMSQYVKSWKVGDTAFWRGPFGGFPYRPNQYGELLMLAAGTGLAPMLPILKDITDDEKDETFVTLVGCFKTFEGIYLKPLLQDLARYWNVRTFFVLSQEDSLDRLPTSYREKTHLGRLGPARIRELVGSCRKKPFALVCGPARFNQDVALGLRGAGLPQDALFLF
ncbi:NADH-cytochrome b5 reductase-like isoform X2 [Gracilinanus agilis]|uniref:NADH-cytochrome b5 reductase-like isoform X2 n=1 Tax=Gracilinanus agilis TaxID=191870 RepID=UPI001CFDC720|nr:NADH-cytochrome b5 reductase-like isoform X2 [Gracilinanus agilis]